MPKTEPYQVSSADLETFRQTLVTKRREMVDLYAHDVKVGQEATDDNSDDFADRANNSYSREMMFALSDTERKILIYIDDAMVRLDKGTYGRCDYCEEAIGLPRLEAVPWARYCVRCQERDEQGMLD